MKRVKVSDSHINLPPCFRTALKTVVCLPIVTLPVFWATPAHGQEGAPSPAATAPVSFRDERGLHTAEVWKVLEEKARSKPNSNEANAIAERPRFQAYYAKYYSNWTAPEPRTPPPGKLRNLSEAPAKPRFPLTGKVWPAKDGEASICLWEDDKLAAVSIGVDDNEMQDIPFWGELSKRYGGLKVTFNLIVSPIGGELRGRVHLYGTWDQWRQALQLEHPRIRVASHSMTHLNCPVRADGWPGLDWETSESKRLLEEQLGVRVYSFVIPGPGVSDFNIPASLWRESAPKYYAAMRSSSGRWINPANQIDYFGIWTTSGIGPIMEEAWEKEPRYAWLADQHPRKLFDPDPANRSYRGWLNIYTHWVAMGKDFDVKFSAMAKVLDFINQHRADLWHAFFDEVILYGQERDTGSVTTDEVTDSRIVLTLTSQMDPAVFDYPLTIKVRLPASWTSCTAMQDQKDIPCELVEHEGARFALVKAVPDRGRIVLKAGARRP